MMTVTDLRVHPVKLHRALRVLFCEQNFPFFSFFNPKSIQTEFVSLLGEKLIYINVWFSSKRQKSAFVIFLLSREEPSSFKIRLTIL